MSKTNTPAPHTPSETQPTGDEAVQTGGIPAFRFPFSPDTYAPKQNDGQHWPNRNGKSNHDKRPHTPPRGTRRSMGKR